MATRRFFTILTICLVLLGGAGLAMSQGRGEGFGKARRAGAGDFLFRMKDQLGLSDQQITQMKDVMKKERETLFQLTQDLRSKKHDLVNLLESASPDPTTLGKTMIAERDLKKQIREAREKGRTDFLAILTPEQKAKVEQLRKNRPMGGQGMRGVGRGLGAGQGMRPGMRPGMQPGMRPGRGPGIVPGTGTTQPPPPAGGNPQ